ncbi:MAG TPA: efflux RND transporter periplasmic adaptor subunit [Spirochaetia bacterium]|nr:efflux RND transporter periplasmic adaptor subunit [Spirochaetia bacterium]
MQRTEKTGKLPIRYVVLALLVLATAVVWFVFKHPQAATAERTSLPVEVVLPAVGTIDQTMTINSYVQSDSVVTVLPTVSGTLVSLSADIGTHLSAGQTIAKIDPEPYRLALDQAKSAYDGAKSTFDRTKQLFESGATSRQNYDQALALYQNTKSQNELAQLHLDYTTITSPVDGTVIVRQVSNGALVSPSVPVVTISNSHTLVIDTQVPEMNALAFEKNRATMQIHAVIPAMQSAPYSLRIRNIAPSVDIRTRTFDVQCEIEGEISGILPGMFARVTFVIAERTGIPYLPFTALVGGNQLWYVDDKETAQPLEFRPSYYNDDYFQIPADDADRRFILAGQHFLSAGTRVKVAGTVRAGK